MRARYVNGLTATVAEIELTATPEGLALALEGGAQVWDWGELRRADDRIGPVILKRRDDLGERLTLDAEAAAAVRSAAPALFRMRSQRFGLIVALMIAAGAISVGLVFGAIQLAEPIARNAPPAFVQRVDQIAVQQMRFMTNECPAGPGDAAGLAALRTLVDRIGVEANLRSSAYNIYVVDARFPNAFAMPGGRIIVTDDLIAMTQSPDELAGVIAHEMAHVAEDHVMVSLVRNMGVGAFVDIVLGGQGAGLTIASFNVASLRHDRAFEAEADALAVRYLDDAGLDPGGLSRFFRRLDQYASDGLRLPELFSTHPDSARRAEELAGAARPGRPPAMTADEWAAVKSLCGLADTAPPSPPP